MNSNYPFPMGGHSSDLRYRPSFSNRLSDVSDEGAKFVGAIFLVIVLAVVIIGARGCLGIGGMGPARTLDKVTVQRMWVDTSSDGDSGHTSHYMVATDCGVFEVDNGLVLGIWNADEIYGRLKEGHSYRIRTQGNRVVGFWWQEYPYITHVEEVTDVGRK